MKKRETVIKKTKTTFDVNKWWNSLDEYWKELFDNEGITSPRKAIAIKMLRIRDTTGITSLEPIKALQNLRELDCYANGIKDISPLAALPKLTRLDLNRKKLADFAPLKKLTSLKVLDISETSIKDLAPLAKLTSLETLNVRLTSVKDLTPLRNLQKLKSINLSGTAITDISTLKSLNKLTTIELKVTKIKSIEPLRNLKKVRELQISDTAVKTLEPIFLTPILHELTCSNTPLSFMEILNFRKSRVFKKDNDPKNLTVWCDFREEKFLEKLETINFDLTDFTGTLSQWAEHEIHKLEMDGTSEDKKLATRIRQAAKKLGLEIPKS